LYKREKAGGGTCDPLSLNADVQSFGRSEYKEGGEHEEGEKMHERNLGRGTGARIK